MLSSQCEQAVQRVSPIFGTESRYHSLGLEAKLPLPNQSNMEHTQSGMVLTAPLWTNQVWFGFPEYCSHCIGSISKALWTWHELSIILSNEARLHGAIYRADSFVLVLPYWVQRYNAPHPWSTYLYQLIHDTCQVPLNRTSFKSMAESGPTMWKKEWK